jgi:hypothetical protein
MAWNILKMRVRLLRCTAKGEMSGAEFNRRLPGDGPKVRASAGTDARDEAPPTRLLIADDHAAVLMDISMPPAFLHGGCLRGPRLPLC